jgi:hypothetical protein
MRSSQEHEHQRNTDILGALLSRPERGLVVLLGYAAAPGRCQAFPRSNVALDLVA